LRPDRSVASPAKRDDGDGAADARSVVDEADYSFRRSISAARFSAWGLVAGDRSAGCICSPGLRRGFAAGVGVGFVRAAVFR
jgi:hypothetical protein